MADHAFADLTAGAAGSWITASFGDGLELHRAVGHRPRYGPVFTRHNFAAFEANMRSWYERDSAACEHAFGRATEIYADDQPRARAYLRILRLLAEFNAWERARTEAFDRSHIRPVQQPVWSDDDDDDDGGAAEIPESDED